MGELANPPHQRSFTCEMDQGRIGGRTAATPWAQRSNSRPSTTSPTADGQAEAMGDRPPSPAFVDNPQLFTRDNMVPFNSRTTAQGCSRVHPPTREKQYGRVDEKSNINLPGAAAPTESHYTSPMLSSALPPIHQPEVTERPKSDKSRLWKSLRPHPMTAISCHDPQWPAALARARQRHHDDGPIDSPVELDSDVNRDPTKDIETIPGDLSFRDMLLLENYLPREAPKWIFPYQDVTAHLSKRETAGHLIPSNDNGEPAFYFVFSDLAIRNEGYFSLRFHIVNLDWRVHPSFSRPGTGFFSPLCDCVTTPFAVYSTKEFPGLPPTTDFTAYLVRNGVRIRFRDDRVVDAAVGEQKGRADGRRVPRKNSKSVAAISPESGGQRRSSGEAPGIPSTADSKNEALLDAANQLWRSSPGGGIFHRTFDAEEFETGAGDVPSNSSLLRLRSGRSNTMGAIRGVSSPQQSPLLQDRRAYSHSTLDPSFNGSPTMIFSQGPYPPSTFAPRRSIPTLPPHHHLLTQDLGMRPGEHTWSSVSPRSPHGSIPSPGQSAQHAVWLDDDGDRRYAPQAGPSTVNQHSPLMTRDRSHHHRYFPYPQATTAPNVQNLQYDHNMPHDFPLGHASRGNDGNYQPSPHHSHSTF